MVGTGEHGDAPVIAGQLGQRAREDLFQRDQASTVARLGEAVEADSRGQGLGHHLGGVLTVPASQASDQPGVRADHRLHGRMDPGDGPGTGTEFQPAGRRGESI